MRFNDPRDWFGPRTWEGWLLTLLLPVGIMLLYALTGHPGQWGPTGFHPKP